MPKSARYHIDRANSIVFYLKKVATTACFIREESSGGWQISKSELLKCLRSETWACGRQTMHAFLTFLRLFIKCFFRWLHVETISDFLFSKFCLFLSFKIQSFSSKHKLHLFDPPVYEIDCFNTDQVMSKSCLLFFSFQIYFESSVSFEYLLWLKDLMWFLHRSLNVLAVMPM